MAEYNKMAEGDFISNGTAEFVQLPFLPNTFEMWNTTAMTTPAEDNIVYAQGRNGDAAGTASVLLFNATPVLTTATLLLGGFNFIKAGTYQFGPTLTVSSVTQGASALVTTTTDHNLATGDAVVLYGTTAMLQVAGEVYTITRIDATSFTIPVNSTGFTAAAAAGFCKQLRFPDLYIPFRSAITAIVLGATTTITTSVNHRFVVGQEVLIQIPTVTTTAWGTTQLDTEVFNTANVIPQQAYVTEVPTDNSLIINVNSSGFTAFAYPTSAEAALGMTFPAVYAIGDQNFGLTGPAPFIPPITIPGAFAANTRQGVLVGIGDGTQIMHANNDVVRWNATFPDLII